MTEHPGPYRSDALDGAKTEDLLLDLFRRIENLEQCSAGGAATDDMFVARGERIAALEDVTGGFRDRVQEQLLGQEFWVRTTGDILRVLNEIRDRLPAPPPPACGARDEYDLRSCEKEAGHAGRHQDGLITWSALTCGAGDDQLSCEKETGHAGRHQAFRGQRVHRWD